MYLDIMFHPKMQRLHLPNNFNEDLWNNTKFGFNLKIQMFCKSLESILNPCSILMRVFLFR